MAALGARCCMKKKNDKRGGEGDPKPRRDGQIPVVGIGASAGGIGALEALLPLLKADSGIAYVDRKSTRLNSSHLGISYAVFCLKRKTCNARERPWTGGSRGRMPRRGGTLSARGAGRQRAPL